MRRCNGALLAAFALATIAGCTTQAPTPAAAAVSFGGPTMGTTWSVTVVPGARTIDEAERSAIDRDVQETLARVTALLSTWEASSELSRFNSSRSTAPVPVSRETYDVFRWALQLSQETGGAFDMTVLPIVEAWGFGAGGDPDAPRPSAATLSRLKARTGPGAIELDSAAQTARKRQPEVACDVSGLAPGYAADLVVAALERRGLTDFLVDVGGEFVARGHNADGRPWQVAVERPDESSRQSGRVVPLTNAALATSGDYRNYREVDGRRVTHIIDPRTAEPIAHALASVTVIDARAVRADGLATALMVLGPDEGMSLATRLGLPAVFLVRAPGGNFEERTTPQFDALIRTGA
jgi:thiamine biosynthesis lipoprotein